MNLKSENLKSMTKGENIVWYLVGFKKQHISDISLFLKWTHFRKQWTNEDKFMDWKFSKSSFVDK